MLEAIELSKAYNGRAVVDGVSLKVNAGEVVGLLGPNGSGKTTTFHIIIGLTGHGGGKILLNGEDIGCLPMYRRARKGIGYLPQEPSIFRKLTVEENILAILETMDLSRSEKIEWLGKLLKELNIGPLAQSGAYSLSGGERRKVEITRALILSPAFLLLDEPFAGIDPIAVTQIQNIILRLKGKGIGIAITDHNVRETLHICDRVYILSDGKILDHGPPEMILASKTVRRKYLGDTFSLGRSQQRTQVKASKE